MKKPKQKKDGDIEYRRVTIFPPDVSRRGLFALAEALSSLDRLLISGDAMRPNRVSVHDRLLCAAKLPV